MTYANRAGRPAHSTDTTTLSDLLERILDKGVVIAGDIRVKLVEVELLSIEIRLLICSVERAEEIGMDWWRHDRALSSKGPASANIEEMRERLERLERLAEASSIPKGGSGDQRQG